MDDRKMGGPRLCAVSCRGGGLGDGGDWVERAVRVRAFLGLGKRTVLAAMILPLYARFGLSCPGWNHRYVHLAVSISRAIISVTLVQIQPKAKRL